MLLFIAAVGVFVGYHVNWMRARQRFLATPGRSASTRERIPHLPHVPPSVAPGLLSYFGERGYAAVHLDFSNATYYYEPFSDDRRREVSEAKRLFPEADAILWKDRTNMWIDVDDAIPRELAAEALQAAREQDEMPKPP
ncbi:MAG TPA: hypothetical protein VGN12_26055 [Pirellulales bacterium]|jgi:hypothetical protein